MAAFWWFYVLVIDATYSANLIAFLAVDIQRPPFETLSELADQNEYLIGVVGGTAWMDEMRVNIILHILSIEYRSDTVNSNTVKSKFHLIFYEIFVNIFSIISCLKCTVNSNFHLIRSKILPTNDFKLTVPNLNIILNGRLSIC